MAGAAVKSPLTTGFFVSSFFTKDNFFTLRKSWAWDSLAWYGEQGYHRWPWVAHYPQCIGWDQPGVAEQVPVAVGQHPLSGIGRSFHDGQEPPTDEYDVTPFTPQGLHFAEQWKRALEVDPEFVFVTGWNEWTAGAVECDDPSYEALQAKWSFFPGAKLGKAAKPLKVGDIYFIDQYNQEFSRDIEPMRGGHTDNYYYQLVDGIRRYKGARPLPPTSAPKTIDLHGTSPSGTTCSRSIAITNMRRYRATSRASAAPGLT